MGTSSIKKFDIPLDSFFVYTDKGKEKLPLEEVKSYFRPACKVCFDMTSEFADSSVGAVEGVESWNTVIIRSNEGKKLIEEASEEGVIEIRELEKERVEHLKEASRGKKIKALERIEEMKKEKGIDIYFRISEEERERLKCKS